MFLKGSKQTPETMPVGPKKAELPTPGVPSIISSDLKIVGDLTSDGDIQIDGTVEGDIRSRALTIGEGAIVRGAIMAETVRIYGTLTGEIEANGVTLAKTAKVEGDITHRTLSMEAGASLVGQLRRLTASVSPSDQNAQSGSARGRDTVAGGPDTGTQSHAAASSPSGVQAAGRYGV